MDVEDQIPPTLPLQKGGISPLWYPFPVFKQAKRGWGRFLQQHVFSIMDSLVSMVRTVINDVWRNESMSLWLTGNERCISSQGILQCANEKKHNV